MPSKFTKTVRLCCTFAWLLGELFVVNFYGLKAGMVVLIMSALAMTGAGYGKE